MKYDPMDEDTDLKYLKFQELIIRIFLVFVVIFLFLKIMFF